LSKGKIKTLNSKLKQKIKTQNSNVKLKNQKLPHSVPKGPLALVQGKRLLLFVGSCLFKNPVRESRVFNLGTGKFCAIFLPSGQAQRGRDIIFSDPFGLVRREKNLRKFSRQFPKLKKKVPKLKTRRKVEARETPKIKIKTETQNLEIKK
jgi:hypothetical protein